MTIENDLGNINQKLNEIDSGVGRIYRNLPGVGLYAMVLLTLLRSCDLPDRNQIRQVVSEELRNNAAYGQVTEPPRLITRDVFGNQEPEQFYEISGQRTYVQIDGKPIAEYMRNPAEAQDIGE